MNLVPLTCDAGGNTLRFDADAGAQMECLLADFGQMYRERNEALKEVANAHHDALFRLALAAEFKDDDTGIHIVRIGFHAEALALGQSQPWAELLRKAAPMHDIGKIGIPDAVLAQEAGQFDAGRARGDQPARAHRCGHPGPVGHPAVPVTAGPPQGDNGPLGGSAVHEVTSVGAISLAAEVALTHHERFDGRGYPNSLTGNAIALSGRIVSVVDFFDALTMDRCYRRAIPDAIAKDMLRVERGNAFDPQVVDTFLAHWPRFIALRDRITRLHPTFADLVRGSVDAVDNLETNA